MLRTYIPTSAPWFERAMSYIQSEEMDRSEKWLHALAPLHLFGACSDRDAEKLWSISYDALFYPMQPKMHTVKGLEKQVLDILPEEVCFLSVGEYTLLQRLLMQDGHMLVMNHGELACVESLVRRLWCSVDFNKDGSIGVHMPQELVFRINSQLCRPAFTQHAFWISEFLQKTDSILLWKGVMPADIAMNQLKDAVRMQNLTEDTAKRLFMSCYDYAFLHGRMILLHPGVIDPAPFSDEIAFYPDDVYEMNEKEALAEWDNITSISMILAGLCTNAVRKDFDPQDVAADITILAKQGAPLEGLFDALASDLVISPTEKMLDCVRMIYAHVPLWPPFVWGGGN